MQASRCRPTSGPRSSTASRRPRRPPRRDCPTISAEAGQADESRAGRGGAGDLDRTRWPRWRRGASPVRSCRWTPPRPGSGRWPTRCGCPSASSAPSRPFNFPLNLVAHKVAPALAAGCAVVLKPAGQTPLSALLLAELETEAGLPPGWLNVARGPLGGDRRRPRRGRARAADHVHGLRGVGWKIRERAARKKVNLELGNATPVIVEADADLEDAPPSSPRTRSPSPARAASPCSGSTSGAGLRRLRRALRPEGGSAQRRRSGRGGHRCRPGHRRGRPRAHRLLDRGGEGGGATVLTGGEVDDGLLRPTVLADVTPEMKVSCRRSSARSAPSRPTTPSRRRSSSRTGPNTACRPGSSRRASTTALAAARGLEFGGVTVNEAPTFRADQMPYGGVKAPGNTKEGPALRGAGDDRGTPRRHLALFTEALDSAATMPWVRRPPTARGSPVEEAGRGRAAAGSRRPSGPAASGPAAARERRSSRAGARSRFATSAASRSRWRGATASARTSSSSARTTSSPRGADARARRVHRRPRAPCRAGPRGADCCRAARRSSPGAHFCSNCGRPVPRDGAQSSRAPTAASRSRRRRTSARSAGTRSRRRSFGTARRARGHADRRRSTARIARWSSPPPPPPPPPEPAASPARLLLRRSRAAAPLRRAARPLPGVLPGMRDPAARPPPSACRRRRSGRRGSPLWLWAALAALLLVALVAGAIVAVAATREDEEGQPGDVDPDRLHGPQHDGHGRGDHAAADGHDQPADDDLRHDDDDPTRPRPRARRRSGHRRRAATRHVAGREGRLLDLPEVGADEPGAREGRRGGRQGANNGLTQVGVLNSTDYSSLNPGYWVTFTGIYDTEPQANAALPTRARRGSDRVRPRCRAEFVTTRRGTL